MRIFTKLFAIVLALSALPAHASGLFETWKMVRPQGPGCVFYVKLESLDYMNLRKDLYYSQVPGSLNITSAPMPCDVSITVTLIMNGSSGKYAKDQDRKEMRLVMINPTTRERVVWDEQTKKTEERKSKDARWSGILSVTLTPRELPPLNEWRDILFKVEWQLPQDAPSIMLSRPDQTLRGMIEEAAGIEPQARPSVRQEQEIVPQRQSLPVGPSPRSERVNGARQELPQKGRIEMVKLPSNSTGSGFDPDRYEAEHGQTSSTSRVQRSNPGRMSSVEIVLVENREKPGRLTQMRRLHPPKFKFDDGGQVSQILSIPGNANAVTGQFEHPGQVQVLISPESRAYWMERIVPDGDMIRHEFCPK